MEFQPKASCARCLTPDDLTMISCKRCNQLFHLRCTSFNSEKRKQYTCNACAKAFIAERANKPASTNKEPESQNSQARKGDIHEVVPVSSLASTRSNVPNDGVLQSGQQQTSSTSAVKTTVTGQNENSQDTDLESSNERGIAPPDQIILQGYLGGQNHQNIALTNPTKSTTEDNSNGLSNGTRAIQGNANIGTDTNDVRRVRTGDQHAKSGPTRPSSEGSARGDQRGRTNLRPLPSSSTVALDVEAIGQMRQQWVAEAVAEERRRIAKESDSRKINTPAIHAQNCLSEITSQRSVNTNTKEELVREAAAAKLKSQQEVEYLKEKLKLLELTRQAEKNLDETEARYQRALSIRSGTASSVSSRASTDMTREWVDRHHQSRDQMTSTAAQTKTVGPSAPQPKPLVSQRAQTCTVTTAQQNGQMTAQLPLHSASSAFEGRTIHFNEPQSQNVLDDGAPRFSDHARQAMQSTRYDNARAYRPEPAPWLRAQTDEEFIQSFQQLSSISRKLTREESSARQSTPRDLPTFTGDPKDWPHFITSFINSTKVCNFSNEENLLRLNNALKGKALKAVGDDLLDPDDVPEALTTLRNMFGKPELVLKTITNRVRTLPAMRGENMDQLVEFSNAIKHLVSHIKRAGLSRHLDNPILVDELVEKLPQSHRIQYSEFLLDNPDENLESFSHWLKRKADAACLTSMRSMKPPSKPTHQKKHEHVFVTIPGKTSDQAPSEKISRHKKEDGLRCIVCKNTHSLEACSKFKEMNNRERWKLIISSKYCGSCLGHHNYRFCKLRRRRCSVDGCRLNHHMLLHRYPDEDKELDDIAPEEAATFTINTRNPTTVFRIIPIELFNQGKTVSTYAFVDEGSSITLMEDSLASELGLEGFLSDLCLKWTGDTSRVETDSRIVDVTISGVKDDNKYLLSRVRTVKHLNLPRQTLDPKILQRKYPHLRELDIPGYVEAQPKLLIGLAHWSVCVPLKMIEGKSDEPVATLCRIGWTISGVVGKLDTDITQQYHICECQSDEILHREVRDFFNIDNFGTGPTKTITSQIEQRAMKILEEETRLVNNRYEARLLWKRDNFSLPPSKSMARRRMECLRKKMQRNPDLKKNLMSQIEEYLAKGYIRKLSPEEAKEQSPRTWYLPVFAVTNPNKPEKVRLVWDAAAKVQGISLNDELLKGPDLLTPLYDVLIRFRRYSIAISGDIKEMFHQVLVAAEDRNSQRFLWIDQDGREEAYEMCVMTFGATCSPSTAQYVKNLNASRFTEKFPEAVHAIQNNHYVDDYLDSFKNSSKALEVARQVRLIHSSGGFNIRNWTSNSQTVLSGLGEKLTPTKNLDVGSNNTTRVLGLVWDIRADVLTFSVNEDRFDRKLLDGSTTPTKRQVLRILMTIFDPLGLIAHILVQLKILLQDIWRSQIEWDQQIDPEHLEAWLRWVQVIPLLQKVKIPRCLSKLMSEEMTALTELHVFVDASENAFAAVAYLRVTQWSKLEISLISAKTKVAPQKPMSIPRLELQAAVLGTRLANTVQDSLNIQIHSRTFWSDSSTVLAWLRSNPRKHQQFIALRLGEILENTELREWRYVPTALNVADEATKWTGAKVETEGRWFTGPSFLQDDPSTWPENRFVLMQDRRFETCGLMSADNTLACPNLKRFSKWRQLVNSQAWVLKLILKKFRKRRGEPHRPNLLHRAEEELIRKAQKDCYGKELLCLIEREPLPVESELVPLTPFADSKQIIRMRGRTSQATKYASWGAINPIILPRQHRITYLLLDDYHRRFHHVHHESVVNEVRQRYWVPQLRVALKNVRSSCQHCKMKRRLVEVPIMADLPEARLSAFTRPFTHTGLDYFGPMEVVVGRHIEKRYIALFTCLTIRAVHLEMTTSLSTSSAILAVRAFIARRGLPQTLWTDNGTNFRGASNELKAELQNINPIELQKCFDQIDWRFIPPASPHMGGSWERLVRTVKSVLQEVMPARKPQDEVLRGAIMEVERIVNCRPLTYVPVDRDNPEALTPNHFLLGSSDGSKPPGIIPENSLETKKLWKMSQVIADQFWKRWVREYLPTLTRRTKWCTPVSPTEIGDVGMIWDETVRGSWKIARVEDIRRSKDGAIRVIVVRTANGLYTRPVSKFAKLDVSSPNESEDRLTLLHWGESVGTAKKTWGNGLRPRQMSTRQLSCSPPGCDKAKM